MSMDAEREREIRELAARLLHSNRHRRIGLVLNELLAEVDALRREIDAEEASNIAESARIVKSWTERGYLDSRSRNVKRAEWLLASLARSDDFPSQSHT